MTSRNIPPPAVAAEWAWQLRGLCRDVPNTLFFHPERERGSTRRRRDAAAKAICGRCPVIVECRRHALAAEEPYGVWGGQDENERRLAIAHRRRRGRQLAAS